MFYYLKIADNSLKNGCGVLNIFYNSVEFQLSEIKIEAKATIKSKYTKNCKSNIPEVFKNKIER